MARVVNLGQFPVQTTLAQNLSQALESGVKTGTAIANARTRRNVASAALEQQGIENKRAEAKEAREVEKAKQTTAAAELSQAKNGLEFGENVQEMLSRRLNNAKDDSMRQVIRDSDQVSEITKQVKQFAPQLIGDDGNIITLSEGALLKKDLNSTKEIIFRKVSEGTPLTPGEQKLAEVFTRIPPESVAALYGELFDTDAFRDNEEADIPEATRAANRQVIIKNFFNSIPGIKGGNVFSSALSQDGVGGGGSGDFTAQDNPLGLNL